MFAFELTMIKIKILQTERKHPSIKMSNRNGKCEWEREREQKRRSKREKERENVRVQRQQRSKFGDSQFGPVIANSGNSIRLHGTMYDTETDSSGHHVHSLFFLVSFSCYFVYLVIKFHWNMDKLIWKSEKEKENGKKANRNASY